MHLAGSITGSRHNKLLASEGKPHAFTSEVAVYVVALCVRQTSQNWERATDRKAKNEVTTVSLACGRDKTQGSLPPAVGFAWRTSLTVEAAAKERVTIFALAYDTKRRAAEAKPLSPKLV